MPRLHDIFDMTPGDGLRRVDTMVSANGISKRFGHILAVDNVTLAVRRGEVLGFLGPNGSGKSTTMKMITGFLKPATGDVEICGVGMSANPVDARRCIGYLPEGAPAYADITTLSYLNFIASMRRLTGRFKQQAIDYVISRIHLANVLHQPVGTLSKGYKRRVGLAQALLHNPDVLILDEPTDGLDPNQKREVRSLIREISPDKAIIVSTHILEEVEAICTRALIIADGRIVADGTPREIERRSRYHNAVSLTVPSSIAATVRAEMERLPQVNGVEIMDGDNGGTELVALPADGGDILSTIAGHARSRGWPIRQIRAERGRLDEVFRDVTDAGTVEDKTAKPASSRAPDKTPKMPLLHDVWAICKNELTGYFVTPVAYVFVVIFLAAVNAFTFFLGGFFARGEATLDAFFQFHPWLYLFFIPAVSMRLWTEEHKSGSIEILLTLPVTTLSAVCGKFLAAWAVVGVSLLLTTPIWLSVNYLGSPDNGIIAAGYFGSLVMAGGYLSVGAFVSAMTKNQIIAFIITVALCFVFTASGLNVVVEFFGGWAPPALLDGVANFSFLEHFRDISRGIVNLRDVIFFISTVVFFLFANVVAVEHRKNA